MHDAIARDRICNFKKEEEMGEGKAHSGDFFFLVAELSGRDLCGVLSFFFDRKKGERVGCCCCCCHCRANVFLRV